MPEATISGAVGQRTDQQSDYGSILMQSFQVCGPLTTYADGSGHLDFAPVARSKSGDTGAPTPGGNGARLTLKEEQQQWDIQPWANAPGDIAIAGSIHLRLAEDVAQRIGHVTPGTTLADLLMQTAGTS